MVMMLECGWREAVFLCVLEALSVQSDRAFAVTTAVVAVAVFCFGGGLWPNRAAADLRLTSTCWMA